MRYLPHTPEEIEGMLEVIGRPSVESLFESIPKALRLDRPLDLPPALDELSLLEHLEALQADTAGRPFLGAGCYPHHVPPVVSQLLTRGEILTAYTPYQPECAQGTLQLIFEYQTMVTALTGLEVANASMYDGAHAAAEAALMALRLGKRRQRVLVSGALHPEYLEVIETYLGHGAATVERLPLDATGRTDLAALEATLSADVAAVMIGYPNFFGVVEPLDAAAALAHAAGALCVSVTAEPVSLGLLQAPGALGADLAVGELGAFGNPMSLGGPMVGFFAAREAHLRQLPGRLCGATVDVEGRRGFVLTLSTREQHIRRAKATSNICTNQGLSATAAALHLSLLGRHGLRELADVNYQRARYCRERLAEGGVPLLFEAPTFNEFAVQVDDVDRALAAITAAGLEGGLALRRFFPDLGQGLLLCVTELHSPEMIDALVAALASAQAPGGAR